MVVCAGVFSLTKNIAETTLENRETLPVASPPSPAGLQNCYFSFQ